ncbi:hypothetical protein BS47DRAFT_1367880 [Hydnum rufescens UP504]|uniref:Uncharacterized protein n=1 Tax=Hydnum rufescens UP504 TaxID=1448309 RepID=A0A9P6DNY6_9AGAM|nr:hypothetical protein BS47DRAFT_1367880 [Hydnum rufescens UP504]
MAKYYSYSSQWEQQPKHEGPRNAPRTARRSKALLDWRNKILRPTTSLDKGKSSAFKQTPRPVPRFTTVKATDMLQSPLQSMTQGQIAKLLLAFTKAYEPSSGHDIYTDMDGPAPNVNHNSDEDEVVLVVPADGGGYNNDDEDKDDGESSVELGGELDEDTCRHTSNNCHVTWDLDRHLSDSTDNREADHRTLATLDKYQKIYDRVAAKNPKAKADDDEQVFSITVECPTLDCEACMITVDSEITWDAFLMRVAEAMVTTKERLKDKNSSTCGDAESGKNSAKEFKLMDDPSNPTTIESVPDSTKEHLFGTDFVPKRCGKVAAALMGPGSTQYPFPAQFMNAMMFGMHGYPPPFYPYLPPIPPFHMPLSHPSHPLPLSHLSHPSYPSHSSHPAYQYPNPSSHTYPGAPQYPPAPSGPEAPTQTSAPATKASSDLAPSSKVDINNIAEYPYIFNWLSTLDSDKQGSCSENWGQYEGFLSESGILCLDHLVAGCTASQLAEMCQMPVPLATCLLYYGQHDTERCLKDALKAHKHPQIK